MIICHLYFLIIFNVIVFFSKPRYMPHYDAIHTVLQKAALWFTDSPDIMLIDDYMPLAEELKTVVDMHVVS